MVKHKGPQGPFLIVAIIFLISSCSTIEKTSFSTFKENIKNASSVASSVVVENKKMSKMAFIYSIHSKEKSLDKIYYPFSGELKDPPYYYRFKDLKEKIVDIHRGLIKYAKTLEYIATGRDKDKLKKLTASSTSFLNSFTNDKTVGIATTAVYSSLEWMSREKRKKLLVEVIEKNQPIIKEISKKLVGIIQTLESSLHLSYDRYFYDLKSHDRDIDTISKAVELSEKYKRLRNKLSSLKKLYSTIPEAHNNLKNLDSSNIIEFSSKAYSDYTSFQ